MGLRWYKTSGFFTPGGKTLVYIEPEKLFPHKPVPLNYPVRSAIYALQDEEAIEVIGEEDFGPKSGVPIKWEIKILQPRFKEFADELFDSDNPNNVIGNTILKWGVVNLNIKSGRASVNNKSHLFKIQKPPFKIFKVLLEKEYTNKMMGR